MHQRIVRLFTCVLLAFLVLVGWQSYWHLAQSDQLLAHPRNRRLARVEQATPRGAIYDRTGTRLAWTEHGTRHYAAPRQTAAVLGYMSPRYGRTGVEGEWDLELAGLARTFTPQELHRITTGKTPHGNDLQLTLDLRLQRAATEALGARNGAVVVLDPATGGILAMATYPTFDPTTLQTDYAQLAQRRDGPLRNRATQDIYPPGSTMKVLTAAAALMHDIAPDTRYTCAGKTPYRGFTITDYHGAAHGNIAMPLALAKSCNYYFARTAIALGLDNLNETATAFGFNQSWWAKLPDPRMLPVSMARSSILRAERDVPDGELAQMGFGQATVVATPLQMAMVAAGVANDGTLMAPYLVQTLRKENTTAALRSFSSAPVGYPLSAEQAEALAGMMRGVVTHGTATGAGVRGTTVYGKTGTAQQRGGEDHAWFIGFAERGEGDARERIAFAVVVERGGTGGRIAVPVARKVIETWAPTARGAHD